MKRSTRRGLFARIASSLATRRIAKQRDPRRRSLGFEGLESRSLLTVVSWDGGGGDLDWNNAANWSGDMLPAGDDDVTISAAGDVTILHSFGAVEIHSLVSQESINWSGGSLSLNGDSTVFGQFNNDGLVEVHSGTLALGGGGTSSGAFQADTGTTLIFGNPHQLTASSSVSADQVVFAVDHGVPATEVAGSYQASSGTTVGGSFGNVIFSGSVTSLGSAVGIGGDSVLDLGRNSATTGALSLGGGLRGSGTVTVTGELDWFNGFMVGTGTTTVSATAVLNIIGGGGKSLDGYTLNNAGTAVWTGTGSLQLGPGAVVNNLPGATFDVQTDADVLWGGGPAEFNNAGLFVKSAGTGDTNFAAGDKFVGINFNNDGLVEVHSGTLALGGGGTSSGSFQADAGTTLVFGNPHQLTASSSVSADQVVFAVDHSVPPTEVAGTYQASSGTTVGGSFGNVIFSGSVTSLGSAVGIGGGSVLDLGSNSATTGALSLGGGLRGNGTVTVTEELDWFNGFMAGTGTTTVSATAVLNIIGGIALDSGRRLDNAGTAVWTGTGGVQLGPGAVVNNLAGATFDVQTDADMIWGGGPAEFNNAGLFVKSAGTGDTNFAAGDKFVGINFNNDGLVEVHSGTLALGGGGTSSGAFQADAGTTLVFGNPHQLTASSSVSADQVVFVVDHSVPATEVAGSYQASSGTTVGGSFGTVVFSGSVTSLGSAVGIGGGSVLDLGSNSATTGALSLGGGLRGNGTVTVTEELDWFNGFMAGTGTTTVSATAVLNIIGGGKSLDDYTLNNYGAGTWSGGSIDAVSGAAFHNYGLLDIVSDQFFGRSNLPSSFHNHDTGILRKTAGIGTSEFRSDFMNDGLVDVQSGVMTFGSFVQTAGATRLSGGSISGYLEIQAGSIVGVGSILGSVQNSGQVSPGFSAGVIAMHGNYVQTLTGDFQVEIGGLAAATEYDQLHVTGSVTLAGALHASIVNAAPVQVNDVFAIIVNDGSAVIGSFDGLPEGAEVTTADGSKFRISYVGGDGNDVTLTCTYRPPVIREVTVDIQQESLNTGANGALTVVVYGDAGFDVSQIVIGSVQFAGAAVWQFTLVDVNQDGRLDLQLKFRTQDTILDQIYADLLVDDFDADGVLDSTQQTAEVAVTGQTFDDVLFRGSDQINLFLSGRSLRELLDDLFGA